MIRAILVDDEENALDILEILLTKMGNVTVIGKHTNPLDALNDIESVRPDAVFIDIHMPGISGTEAAKAISASSPETHTVFTTAYSEYAVEAFAIGSLDYILKPITMERLQQSVERITRATEGVRRGGSHPMIRCMGGFSFPSMTTNVGQMSWRTKKEKELCAFLCHHAGKHIDQTVIMEALWPDADGIKARSYLYTCVSLLRKNLRKNGVSVSLDKTGDGYALDIDGIPCDWVELQSCLDRGISSENLDTRLLERITVLYRDDYMKDCDYDWATQKREELIGKYIHVLRQFAAWYIKQHNLAASIDCMQKVLKVCPESEMDGRALMSVFVEARNRNEAVKVYRQLERAVTVGLDAELEEETVLLYQQIVSSNNERGTRISP